MQVQAFYVQRSHVRCAPLPLSVWLQLLKTIIRGGQGGRQGLVYYYCTVVSNSCTVSYTVGRLYYKDQRMLLCMLSKAMRSRAHYTFVFFLQFGLSKAIFTHDVYGNAATPAGHFEGGRYKRGPKRHPESGRDP